LVVLKLYNTLTRKKEDFRPLDQANVRMYVCGPTVYDFAHIGNARPVIVFDVLYRLLRHIYGPEHVTYVRNITDVDDKINARAAEEHPDLPLNEAIRRVTEKTEAQFHADMAALGALDPSAEPRATEHIEEMKAMIERLVENGCAYVAEDHVLFHVAAMPDYGKLSGRSLDEMIAGARVEVAPFKQDPMDFVLWKPSKPGEPSWPSPAGIKAPGRPGWHIECSAMAAAHLGETFDIHGGGIDLVFPHHENEIAQSRCTFHTPVMAQVWMHNGFLQVEGEKMAKSAGNFVTVHELLKDWPGDVIRLQMLMTHYRQPLDWTAAKTREADDILRGWLEAARLSIPRNTKAQPSDELVEILSDDLNTPEAIAYLHGLSSKARSDSVLAQRFVNDVVFLGIFRDFEAEVLPTIKASGKFADESGDFSVLSEVNQSEWLRRSNTELDSIKRVLDNRGRYLRHMSPTQEWSTAGNIQDVERLNSLIDSRLEARAAKNFKEADRIRDELAAMGVTLKDAKDPKTGELVTTWEMAR
jgi:cysteinyl-tRNA synthetase